MASYGPVTIRATTPLDTSIETMDARPDIKPYGGQLNAHQAAAAMQAARLNSLDLVDTAEILFNLKRFAHSVPFSILAIEESGKIIILQAILLGFDDLPKLWRAYRRHQAKTAHLNIGIRARVRATFSGRVPRGGPGNSRPRPNTGRPRNGKAACDPLRLRHRVW